MKFFVRIFVASVLAAALLSSAPAWAQTSNTGLVLGTVTDPGGAVVPDAKAQLINMATNETKEVMTNSSGQFTFPGVTPGTYKVTITKAGFATFVVANLIVDVTKSYTVDVKMEIRSGSETVEVSAGAQAELQTTDAVVGNVVAGEMLTRLPTLNRDATELLTLQPGSTPYDDATGFGNGGGTIAGARSDQNTVSLDGIDITDNVITGGANEAPIIPVGVDAVDEFRVGVTNANATFGRSSGGQITLISHSGTNQYHGTAYWFHQNDNLNANTWELNHTPDGNGNSFTKKPETKDNRVGASFGGPIRKDKTFIFGNYEIRRFPQALAFTRLVPSDTLKQGILVFGGKQYDLATSTACGAGGTTACDPRGLGISPTVKALWALMPSGNDNTVAGADGANILGFRGTVPAGLKNDGVAVKLDHSFTDKVHFFGRYSYNRSLSPNGSQIDLRGTPSTPSGSQLRGDSIIGGLDWQIRPNLLNSFRGGWVRSRQDFTVIRPSSSAEQLALPGTASNASQTGFVSLAPGLATGGGFLDTIVDVDTQRARHQAIYDSNKQYVETLTWIRGKHTVVAGAEARWLPTIHDRDDKVIGSVNSLVAALDGDHNFGIPAANRPPGLPSGEVTRWDRLYAASLGLVDNVGILTASDGKLNPLPFGTTLIARATLRSHDFFAQDTWRIKPSLTLTYGLSYGWQTTPHEKDGKQTIMVNNDNGNSIFTAKGYLDAKAAAAANGDFYNPTIGYMPINSSGRSDAFSVDYGDWAPRFSVAWNPSHGSGILGRVFGDRKTVVRAGYGIAYDRINTVGSVIIPMLGVGFAQTLTVFAPTCDANGIVANCAVNTTPGGSIFRVGVDGAIPTPAPLGAQSIPVVPQNPFSEILSFANDPDFKVGRSHMIDFTIQREMRGNMLLEVGYIGRLARDLLNNTNFNSSPIMFKDKISSQTFAQAYDTVSGQLRAGVTPVLPNGTVNPAFQTQQWFENLLPGFGVGCGRDSVGNPTNITSTACVATSFGGDFSSFNVSDLFLNMDIVRAFGLGLPTFNNLRMLDLFVRTHRDMSNYHAAFIALHNRGWHGLQFDLNYTFSKSLDQIGTVQNSASYYASSYNPKLEYGPSFFDRTHIFNATYNYNLPLGHGHRLGSSSQEWFNKIIGGWYTAGIFRANSGTPLTVTEGLSGGSLGGGIIFGVAQGAIPTVDPSSLGGGVHHNVCSTNGVASSGDGPNCGSGGGSGTGINYFANPSAAVKDFRPILLASDGRTGRSRPLRGFGLWNLDMRIGKETKFREKYGFEISADFFNAFNHPDFLNPSLDLTNQPTFGVVSSTLVPANRNSSSRWIQLGLRVNF